MPIAITGSQKKIIVIVARVIWQVRVEMIDVHGGFSARVFVVLHRIRAPAFKVLKQIRPIGLVTGVIAGRFLLTLNPSLAWQLRHISLIVVAFLCQFSPVDTGR